MSLQFPLDWWFEPWRYAATGEQNDASSSDLLRRRDGYSLWCSEHAVVANLPEAFDPAWRVAIVADSAELLSAARLFGGLMAAREQNMTALNTLLPADRKWCLAVAATQPLRPAKNLGEAVPAETRGLVELARRLEKGFPGMWSRLKLLLPDEAAHSVTEPLRTALSSGADIEPSPTRAQRCWNLCRERARTAAGVQG